MTRQELLICLHRYTAWELLHMQNPNALDNMDELNQSMEFPISETEKSYGLHLPRKPGFSGDTFSEAVFFSEGMEQEIQIIQHDRYSPPVLHNHDFFEFIYVYEGEFAQQINSWKLLMHTGDFCLIPPQVHHSLDVQNYSIVLNLLIPKSKFRDMIFNGLHGSNLFSDFFIRNASAARNNDYIIFHTYGDTQLQQIILDLCLERLNKDAYYIHMMNTYMMFLLGLLLRNYAKNCELPAPKQKKAEPELQILWYIEKYYRTLTLKELAEQFHYSPQHMSLLIRRLTGISFTEYQLQKRMQAASDLLVKTSMKIKSISESVGYCNQEHFIRTFHKYYGCTPGKYRNFHQGVK